MDSCRTPFYGPFEKKAFVSCYSSGSVGEITADTAKDFVFLVLVFLSFGLLYMFSDRKRLHHSKLSPIYDLLDRCMCPSGPKWGPSGPFRLNIPRIDWYDKLDLDEEAKKRGGETK